MPRPLGFYIRNAFHAKGPASFGDDVTVAGDLTVTGAIVGGSVSETSAAVLAAAGANQGNAAAIATDLVAVTGADGTKGVKLPTAAVGKEVVVINTDAAAVLKVYPATGASINSLSANAAISIGPGQQATFVGTSTTKWYAPQSATLAFTVAQAALLAQGVAAGYKIARGVHTQSAASDTVVTGLATVVGAVAGFDSAPTVKQLFCSAQIGNQSGAPAAGSILIKTFKPTAVNDVTPVAATDFSENLGIAWIAVGT